jgi:hypothetical protein
MKPFTPEQMEAWEKANRRYLYALEHRTQKDADAALVELHKLEHQQDIERH